MLSGVTLDSCVTSVWVGETCFSRFGLTPWGVMVSAAIASIPPCLCLVDASKPTPPTLSWEPNKFGCGETRRRQQKRSDCTQDTMSSQSAYLQSVLTRYSSLSTKPDLHSLGCFPNFKSGFLPVDSLHSMPVIKPLLAGALTHSHLWIELQLSHLHSVVTAGMCRLIVWSGPKRRSCIVDRPRLKPQRHTKKSLAFSSELLRVTADNTR